MLHNVCSTTERILRVVIGLAVLSLLYFIEPPFGYLGLIGLIPIATAVFRYCPFSQMLGANSCGMAERQG